MKTTLTFLSVVLVMLVFSCHGAFGQATEDTWDDFGAYHQDLINDMSSGDQNWHQGRGWTDGRRWGQGRGRGRGWSKGGGVAPNPEMKHGQKRGRGRGRGQGRGPGKVDPQELLEFLKKHEPKLAEKTIQLKEEEPRRFRHRIWALSRMYGPAMRMMENDPAMGKLLLKKIRLKEGIGRLVKKAKKSSKDKKTAEAKIRVNLTKKVSNLFNLVIAQNELHLKNMRERISDQPGDENVEKKPKKGKGRKNKAAKNKTGKNRERKHRGPRRDNQRHSLNRLQKDIETWKSNKDKIIKQRVTELLKGVRPFPWK